MERAHFTPVFCKQVASGAGTGVLPRATSGHAAYRAKHAKTRGRRRHLRPLPGSRRTRRGPKTVVVRLQGALWSDRQAEVADRLRTALADRPRSLIIDMLRVSHFSHACASAFVSTAVTAHRTQTRLLVRGAPPQVWQSLRTLGIAHVFERAPDTRLRHLWGRQAGRRAARVRLRCR
ncbi:STAS domain-containing protein [Streptomyces sp. NPDC093065]|uniref:STAS domain-containing protein n=1 Tax=Streptomyces sp. NPDC093065 TaxID=3366021 RepID=UPI00381C57A4